MDETSLSKFGWKCDMFLLVHNQNKSLDGIKHTQCSDSYLFVIDHGFICPVLYRLFCLTKCLVALLWSRHLTMYSLISIFHTDLYRYGLFQIYLWNKQIWKAIPACCVESLWWYFVGIPVERNLVMRPLLDFVCGNVASHACIALI